MLAFDSTRTLVCESLFSHAPAVVQCQVLLISFSHVCMLLLVLQVLSLLGDTSNSWTVTPAGSLITHIRECGTLGKLGEFPLLDYILHPDTQLKQGMNPLDAAKVWPHELSTPIASTGYVKYLKEAYDIPQLRAIERTATHLSAPPPEKGGNFDQGATPLPFTLIQGPPGTGKTHTVLGVLNTWHLVQFQRYYSSLCTAIQSQGADGKPDSVCQHASVCATTGILASAEGLYAAGQCTRSV